MAKIGQVRFQFSASLFIFVMTCECYSLGDSLNLHSIVPAAAQQLLHPAVGASRNSSRGIACIPHVAIYFV